MIHTKLNLTEIGKLCTFLDKIRDMLTLEYYQQIFASDQTKLSKIKKLILADFKQMEKVFFTAVKEGNDRKMRDELHKMYPIVSNLKHDEFLQVIWEYRNASTEQPAMDSLHERLRHCLAETYLFLEQ